MMLAAFLFTDEKIFSEHTKKPRRMTDCMHMHQPRRKTSWWNSCVHNVQSPMASVGE